MPRPLDDKHFVPCNWKVIQFPETCCLWNPESWALESGNSSRNPESRYNAWKPESKFHWQGIRNPSPGIRNPQHRIQNPSPGIRNPSPGIRNPSPGIWNLESGIHHLESRIHSIESRIQDCLGFPYMAQNFIPFTNWLLLIAFQRHRVVVSEKEVNYLNQPRRSLVYFMRPDLDAQIMCLDGSNKYVPIISGNYVKQKLNATYQYWNPQNLSNRRKSNYPWGFSIDFSISWISVF